MKQIKLYPLRTTGILFFFFLAPIVTRAQSGNPVLDAPGLKAAIDVLSTTQNAANAQKVLDFVNANSTRQFASYKEMVDALPADNFIAVALKGISVPSSDTITSSSEIAALTNKVVPHAGFLPTGVIDVAGSFIAQRFKQEMEIAFLEKFREWLQDGGKAGQALRSLFPVTAKVLLQNDPYQYTSFLETLKEALKKDVTSLPINIGSYLATDPFSLSSNQYYYTALLVYNNIVVITNGQSPTLTLRNLANDPLLPKSPQNVQSVITLTSVMSQLLTNPASPDQWMPVSTIRGNLNTTGNVKMFFGLFMLRYQAELTRVKTGTGPTDNLYTLIAKNEPKLGVILDWIKEVAASYDLVHQAFDEIKSALDVGKDVPGTKIVDFENKLANVFRTFFKFPFDKFNITLDPAINQTFELAASSLVLFTELVANIKEKNYGLALASAIDMVTLFIDNTKKEDRNTISLFKKYGNFAVSVAKSDNKAEMMEALNTAALPVGSYRIKRNSFANITLNAYAGAAGGWQKFSSSVPSGVKATNGVLGFTAPIGIAFSWGHRKKDKDSVSGTSSTLFLSALDLGAVTAFRLSHDSSESLPELTFKNIVAPGVYYVYGVRKLPLSIGAGVQYGPQLRSIKDNSAVILPAAWSIRLFVAIDIPVFSFYARTERKDKNKK